MRIASINFDMDRENILFDDFQLNVPYDLVLKFIGGTGSVKMNILISNEQLPVFVHCVK